MSQLPPGFVLDPPARQQPSAELPTGFVLDTAPTSVEKPGAGTEISTPEALLRGVAQGATFNLADEVQGAAAAGGGYLPHQLLGGLGRMGLEWAAPSVFGRRATDAYDQAASADRARNRAAEEQHPWTYGGAQLAGGVGTGVGLARSGLSLAGNAIQRGAGLGRVAALSGVEGGILGGLQGFGSGEGLSGSLETAKNAALAGMGVGIAAPFAIAGASSLARRASAPMSVSPERVAAAQTLRDEGVDLTAGQATGSRALRYAEGEIGGRRAADIAERQGEQFTAAALRRVGETAPRATPDVIDNAFLRIGQQFDDLAARNQMRPDQQFARDLIGTIREYGQMTPASQRAPIIEKLGADIVDATRSGAPIDGAVYQSLRSRIDRAARSAGRDPTLREALYGIRNSLDDAMERSIGASNPADAGLWSEARRQYRNLLTVERAATGAGENAALGLISPSGLRNATVSTQGRRNYARGAGDFADLARAGEALMKPLPDSGTASRTAVRALGTSIPTMVGALAGSGAGPAGTLAGMAAGAAVPRAAGALMMTPAVQAYLMRGAAAPMSPQRRAVLNSLLLGGGAPAGRIAAP